MSNEEVVMLSIKKEIWEELREIVAVGQFVDFTVQESVIGEFPESAGQRQPVKYESVIGELNVYERALCTLMSRYMERYKRLLEEDTSSEVALDQSRSTLKHFVCAREMLFASVYRRYKCGKGASKDGMILDIRKGFKVVLLPGINIVFGKISEHMFQQYAIYAH